MFGKFFKKQEPSDESFVHLDFVKVFPYIFWTSAWATDEEFPAGVRYKILSVRHVPKDEVEAILIQEGRNMGKMELLRASIPVEKFDSSNENAIVQRVEEKFKVKFDRVDMSSMRTFEEFAKKSKEIGWEMS